MPNKNRFFKNKKLNNDEIILTEVWSAEPHIKVYKRRWGVLLTTVLLNVSCGALWINYSAAATIVASYYELSEPAKVNWFASLYFIFAIPFTFLATFLIKFLGLKWLLHIGSALNTIGAIIRALATSGIITDRHTQYYVSLGGQFFAAAANSFFLGIAPKVSQIWFPDSERDLSTAIGSLARPLGVIITQLAVPSIIEEPDDVRLNNYIWLAPAILTQISTLIFITRATPKTPASVQRTGFQSEEPFLKQLKIIFTNLPYMLIFFALGAGIGLIFTTGAVTEQVLCPLGYTKEFAGLASALLLAGGFLGAAVANVLLKRNPAYVELTKIFFILASFFLIILLELYLFPDLEGWLATIAFIFGIFGVGVLPVGLELAIEATYPIDPTISGSFIFLSGQVQAMIYIILIPILASEKEDTHLSECGDYITPMDYTLPLLLLMAVVIAIALTLILFLDTEYKRQNAEKNDSEQKPTLQSNGANESFYVKEVPLAYEGTEM